MAGPQQAVRDPALATTLLRALGPEPFYQVITVDARDGQHRDAMLEAYFRFSIEEGARLGRVVPAPDGRTGVEAVIRHLGEHAAPLVDSSAWYLSIIGVAATRQGTGLGAALLEPTLREADQAQATSFLESFNPRNVRFYERHGLVTDAAPVEPITGAQYRIMIRRPGPP